ncbi:MAG: type IV toxin-antitoxin system AbiEi family antitoxin [Bryobacterales bacterium]|nr:type IV toxin-antitoxin system AbiEi family antitoxin [Bryobacterales bacterium]
MQTNGSNGRSSNRFSLGRFVDQLQASGRYTFTRDEVLAACGCSKSAVRSAAARLERQGRLASPRRGFFVVVPLEYRSAGAPPPAWHVDALMKYHGRPYYVGLLTAASLHGAAHQQAQEFQILTDRPLRPARSGRVLLRFLHKRRTIQTPTVQVRVETGSMPVSSPEATALDLARYIRPAGGIGNVVTVLAELSEKIDPELLVEAAISGSPVAAAQRTGLLLDHVGAGRTTELLAKWIATRNPRTIPLRADRNAKDCPRNRRWRVVVNERLEPDV